MHACYAAHLRLLALLALRGMAMHGARSACNRGHVRRRRCDRARQGRRACSVWAARALLRGRGVAHACGHDVHIAVVLGAGIVLNRLSRDGALPGRVRLIFEPGEEQVPGGAVEVVDLGDVEQVIDVLVAFVRSLKAGDDFALKL